MGLALRGSLAVAAVAVAITAADAFASATHDEYVAQVNPICKSASAVAKRKLSRVKSTGNGFFDYLLKTRLYGKLLNKTIHNIARVEPAPGEEAAVKAWLDESRRTVRLINQLLASFAHPKAHRVKVLI